MCLYSASLISVALPREGKSGFWLSNTCFICVFFIVCVFFTYSLGKCSICTGCQVTVPTHLRLVWEQCSCDLWFVVQKRKRLKWHPPSADEGRGGGWGGRGGQIEVREEWRTEEERKREGAFRKACHLFSLSLAAMGGKTLYLFCTHALAAPTFSSLEWKLRQDKRNPVAVSLILSDRSCIYFIGI